MSTNWKWEWPENKVGVAWDWMIFPADTNLVRILGFTSIHRFLCTGPPQTAEPGLCLGWDNLPRFGALCQVHSLLGGLRARTFHLHRFHLGIHWVDEWLQTVRLQWDRDTYAVVSPGKSESMDRSLSSSYGWVLYIRMRPHVLQAWIMYLAGYLVGIKI